MTRRLKRIAPVKFGLILGIVYGLISLVFIPIFMLSTGISLFAVPHQNSGLPQGLSVAFNIIFSPLLPVFYAVAGCVFGMLAAWLYDVAASWIGGVEFEVE